MTHVRSIALSCAAASHGGIVRVFDRVEAAALGKGLDVSSFLVPLTAKGNVKSAVSVQSKSRFMTIFRSVIGSMMRPRRYDVRLDIAPALYTGLRAGRRIAILHDLAFLDPGLTYISSGQRLYRRFVTKRVVSRADVIIAVSPQTRNELAQFSPECLPKVRVLSLPVDYLTCARGPAETASDVRDRSVVLAFGHGPNKGVEFLLDALALSPTLRLRLVARSTDWERFGYKNMAEKKGVADRIVILDGISDSALRQEYATAGVFVMPSRYEGYGLPVAEALLCSTPTVISPLTVLDFTARGYAERMNEWSGRALLDAITCATQRPEEHWREAQREIGSWNWEAWLDSVLDCRAQQEPEDG
jgi:glycosyltransferase involved in cell wall biosynthesis